MLRAEDLSSAWGLGPFRDIRQQEREAMDAVRKDIGAIDGQIGMAKRAQALRHSPGWQDYVAAVEQAIRRATDELVTTSRSNEYLRQLQGRVQALRDVSTMLTRSDSLLEELAKRRKELEDRLTELSRLMPRQQEQPKSEP